MMDINEIMKCIPHRYPLLLVDKVLEIKPMEYIKTLKNVTYNEHFFIGHFPAKPIMPGVLIVESVAQSAGILAVKSLSGDTEGKPVYFMGIESAKFRKMVTPGDTLVHTVKITKTRGAVCKFSAESYVGDDLVAECSISAMIDV